MDYRSSHIIIINNQMIQDFSGQVLDAQTEIERPEVSPKSKYTRKQQIEREGRNVGHWTNTEKINYYLFIEKHKEHFFKKEMRRTDKIFKQMSRCLQTRAADQCRSHHQKMEKKYKHFENILQTLRTELADQIAKVYEEEKTEASPYNSGGPLGEEFPILFGLDLGFENRFQIENPKTFKEFNIQEYTVKEEQHMQDINEDIGQYLDF